MKLLSKRILRELETETNTIGHCAIYENELQRLWPLDEENRRAKIEQFAKEHGFKLSFYKRGLCAIFEKDKRPARNPSAMTAIEIRPHRWRHDPRQNEIASGIAGKIEILGNHCG
jgi:hypothetical protein